MLELGGLLRALIATGSPLPPPHRPALQAFILKLREEVRWTFGSVQRVKYPVTELLVGDFKNDKTSALHLVCKNARYGPSLLCPDGSLQFVSGTARYVGLLEFVRSIVEPSVKPSTDGADLPEPMIFRLPNKPGVQPPPVESIIMLLVAERGEDSFSSWEATPVCARGGGSGATCTCASLGTPSPTPHLAAWQRFGRNLLFIELFFFLGYLALLSFVSMDRIADEPILVLDPCVTPKRPRRSCLLRVTAARARITHHTPQPAEFWRLGGATPQAPGEHRGRGAGHAGVSHAHAPGAEADEPEARP